MESLHDIPIVDFSQFSLQTNVSDVKESDLQYLGTHITEAFCTIGFVYLKNHGISDSMIQNMFELSNSFFSLPRRTKDVYARPANGSTTFGYGELGRERFDYTKPADVKEFFDVVPEATNNDFMNWPTEVQNFKKDVLEFHSACALLSKRILQLLGIGLKLENEKFLVQQHECLGGSGNTSILRMLNYPEIGEGIELKPEQARCGEHTDYGTITLLFQDNVGGLEVLRKDGVLVPATPIPGTIVVNIADMMQRWTSDRLISTVHRVVSPRSHGKQRKSFAFFVDPDQDSVVKPLDGSDKYKPITFLDYINRRFKETGLIEVP